VGKKLYIIGKILIIVNDSEQNPEDKVTSAKITMQEDGTDNTESGKSKNSK